MSTHPLPNGNADPDNLVARVDALEREVHELSSSLASSVAELARTIGRAPNDATGDEGSGLCRTVAELAQLERATGRKLARSVAAGGAGVVALFELVRQLVEALTP